MSDPFAAPGADHADRAVLPSVQYARYTLLFCGACYVLLGLVLGPAMGGMAMIDPELPEGTGPAIGLCMGAFMFVFCAGIGAINVVAAVGLGSQRRWAWFVALILGATYLSSACLPFGAIILYGLLNEDARKVFLSS